MLKRKYKKNRPTRGLAALIILGVIISFQNCGDGNQVVIDSLRSLGGFETQAVNNFDIQCKGPSDACCAEYGGAFCNGGDRGLPRDPFHTCPGDGPWDAFIQSARIGTLDYSCEIPSEGGGGGGQPQYQSNICETVANLTEEDAMKILNEALVFAAARIVSNPLCRGLVHREGQQEFPVFNREPETILWATKKEIYLPYMSPATDPQGRPVYDCYLPDTQSSYVFAGTGRAGQNENAVIGLFPAFFAQSRQCRVMTLIHETIHALSAVRTGLHEQENALNEAINLFCEVGCEDILYRGIPRPPGNGSNFNFSLIDEAYANSTATSPFSLQILDSESGAPVVGAFVRIGTHSGKTDSNGRVTGHLPHGHFPSYVIAENYQVFDTRYHHIVENHVSLRLKPNAPLSRIYPVPPHNQVPALLPDIEFPYLSDQLEVIVVDANTGAPIHGASIKVGPYNAYSSEFGQAEGLVPRGFYNASIKADGYYTYFDQFEHDLPQRFTIRLQPNPQALGAPNTGGGTIRTVIINTVGGSGKIFGSYGNPICNNDVCTYTDQDGRNISFSVIPNPGFKFLGWSGDLQCQKFGKEIQILDSNINCTATFAVGTALPKRCLSPGSICANEDTACNGAQVDYHCEQCCGYNPNDPYVKIYGCMDYTHYCNGNPISSTAAALSLDKNIVPSNGSVTVSWSNANPPTTTDWIGVFAEGSGDSSPYIDYLYTSSCTRVEGATARSTSSCDFSYLPEGRYNFRMFHNNTFTRLGQSAIFTVESALPTRPPATEADTTSPTANLTAPANLAQVVVGLPVTFKANANDSSGIDRVEFYVDESLICTDTSSAFTCRWTVPPTVGRTYAVEAKSYDRSSNSRKSKTVTVTAVADTVLPVIKLTAPTVGSSFLRGQTVNLRATATDEAGIAKVEFYVNNTLKCLTTSTYRCQWIVPNGGPQSYNIEARGYDRNGNMGKSARVTVTANPDTVAPTAAIMAPTAGTKVNKGKVFTLKATAADNVGVSKVEFYINSSLLCSTTASPYVCKWSVPSTIGNFSIEAKSYDRAGNTTRSAVVNVSSK